MRPNEVITSGCMRMMSSLRATSRVVDLKSSPSTGIWLRYGMSLDVLLSLWVMRPPSTMVWPLRAET